MGHLVRGCLITVAIGCMTFLIITLPFHLYGEIVLNSELATMQAMGIPTTKADYGTLYPRPFNGRDATAEYLDICVDFDETLDQVRIAEPLLYGDLPIVGSVATDWPCWKLAPLQPEMRAILLQVVEDAAPSITRLESLALSRASYQLDQLRESVKLDLPQEILQLAALAEAETGNARRSMELYQLTYVLTELGRWPDQSRESASHLVNRARRVYFIHPLLNRASFDWNELTSLQTMLLAMDSQLMLERLTIENVQLLIHEYDQYEENASQYLSNSAIGYPGTYLYFVLAVSKIFDLIGVTDLSRAQIYGASRAIYKASDSSLLSRGASIEQIFEDIRSQWLGFGPESKIVNLMVSAYVLQCYQHACNLVILGCGVEKYFLLHGRMPESLDSVISGYVPGGQLDPSTDEVYHYESYVDGYKICRVDNNHSSIIEPEYDEEDCNDLPDLQQEMLEVHRPDLTKHWQVAP